MAAMAKQPIVELINVSKEYEGEKVLDGVDLSIDDGQFLTLLGPSGCGKTTLLRLIAGFETPTSGKVLIASKDASTLQPQERNVNTVFQSYALFPHMSLFDNVAFGLRCSGINESEIRSRVNEMLRMVCLEGYEKRRPHELSGGQQQRVAIARAAVKEPLLLLLDEPLSSLDYRLRKNMQIELKQLQRKLGIAFVFVTHDQEEALTMSDKIIVLQKGRIAQQGTPMEIYENPNSLSVATFIGEGNLFDVTIEEATEKEVEISFEGENYKLANKGKLMKGDRAHLMIRPEDLRLYHQADIVEKKGHFSAVVQEVIYKGSTVDLLLKLGDEKIIIATEFFDENHLVDELYALGETVWVKWPLGWEVLLPYEK